MIVTPANGRQQGINCNHTNSVDSLSFAGFGLGASNGQGKNNAVNIKCLQDATGGTQMYLKGTNFDLMWSQNSSGVPIPVMGTAANQLGLVLTVWFDDFTNKIIIDYANY